MFTPMWKMKSSESFLANLQNRYDKTVSTTDEIVVFLDIYPKNGPLQQLDLPDEDLKSLVREFIVEAQLGSLKDYTI